MIKINVYVKFDDTVILYPSDLKIEHGKITVLCGASGSGKSTIINAIACQNDFASSYEVDAVNILDFDYEKQEDFVCNHYAIVKQNPQLLDDLTIEDHINMVKDFVGCDDSQEQSLLTSLELVDVVSKYPNQLSGGERLRVAILLSLLKNPAYLILDEPTSALDANHTSMILAILKICIKKNIGVLISTHDEHVMEQADYVYKIEEKNIVLKEGDKSTGEKSASFDSIRKFNIFQPYLKRASVHHKVYQRLLYVLVIFMIAVSSLSLGFNNVVSDVQDKQVKSFSSDEIIVYKKTGVSVENAIYGYTEISDPISDEEIKAIKETLHISSLEWRYDFDLKDATCFLITSNKYAQWENYKPKFSLLNKQDTVLNQCLFEDSTVLMSTYLKQDILDKNIAIKFQEEGIYLSNQFARTLDTKIEEIRGKKLNFKMMIPMYSTYGKMWSEEYGDGSVNYLDTPTCVDVDITLPIAGVLKSSSLGVVTDYDNVIYVPRDIVEKQMLANKENNTDILYVMDDFMKDVYINSYPNARKDEIKQVITNHPWKPKAFTAKIDEIMNMQAVTKSLQEKGFQVESGFLKYSALSESTKALQKAIRYASITILSVILLIYVALKFNEREKELHTNLYLRELGISRKKIKKIKLRKYLYRFINVATISIILMISLLLLINICGWGFTVYDIKMFACAIGLSLVIEFIMPIAFEKGLYSD